MSKIGKLPIKLEPDVQVVIENRQAKVKGPKGEAALTIPKSIKAEIKDSQVVFENTGNDKKSRALHGLVRTLVSNFVAGVREPWQKTLEIHGVGFRAKVEAKNVVFNLGFSHPVVFAIPEDVTIAVNGNKIVVSGIDKQRVGEVAASMKRIRVPDKYKGKGLRYQGEVLKLKPGKKAKTAA